MDRGKLLRCKCYCEPVCWGERGLWCCQEASRGWPYTPLLWLYRAAFPDSFWSRQLWWCRGVALCWFYIQLAWWFPKASRVCPSYRQTCSSSWHHPLLDRCFLSLITFHSSGGHPQELPVSGTPWACGSGWVRPWEPVSSGETTEGVEGRTCLPVRCTGQSEHWGGGYPLLSTTACCSCRSHWSSPGASSSVWSWKKCVITQISGLMFSG